MKGKYIHEFLIFSFIIVTLSGCFAAPKPPMKESAEVICVNNDNNETTKITMSWIKFKFHDAEVWLVKDPWSFTKAVKYSDKIYIKGNILVGSKDSSFDDVTLGFNWRNALLAEDTLVLDGQQNLVTYGKIKYVCKKGELSSFISEFDALQKYINDWNIKNNQ